MPETNVPLLSIAVDFERKPGSRQIVAHIQEFFRAPGQFSLRGIADIMLGEGPVDETSVMELETILCSAVDVAVERRFGVQLAFPEATDRAWDVPLSFP